MPQIIDSLVSSSSDCTTGQREMTQNVYFSIYFTLELKGMVLNLNVFLRQKVFLLYQWVYTTNKVNSFPADIIGKVATLINKRMILLLTVELWQGHFCFMFPLICFFIHLSRDIGKTLHFNIKIQPFFFFHANASTIPGQVKVIYWLLILPMGLDDIWGWHVCCCHSHMTHITQVLKKLTHWRFLNQQSLKKKRERERTLGQTFEFFV